MLYLIVGTGKGKTTSGLGMAMRSSGWTNKTAVVFFDKGGDHYGEQKLLDQIQGIDTFRFGLPRFDEANKTFRFENNEEDKVEAERAAQKILELLSQEYFLVVCDELLNALNYGLLAETWIHKILDAKPSKTHLVFSGRHAPEWLTEKADLISEINMVKHYFKKGVNAQKGIEF